MATTSPAGRHRRRGLRPVTLVVAGALLVVAALLAMLSPTLLGWPPPSAPGPSTVARAGSSVTASPSALTGNAPGDGSPAVAPSASPLFSPTPTSAGAPGGSRAGSAALAALEERVVEQTNAERAKKGCAALRVDERLQEAARMHSADMVNSDYFSHTSPDGRDPGRRLADAGYNTDRGWAENIARGYPTAEAVMAGWMDSSGHRANILNCSLKAIGVGTARAGNGRIYWTQDFGGR